MKIQQEPIPTPEEMLEQEAYSSATSGDEYEICKLMKDYLKLHLERIKYEYANYQFLLDGYRNGSASIAEVNMAHSEFLKLLE